MADENERHQRSMSLIPYLPAESRELVPVLRHGTSVVVYNQHSRQLSLRSADHTDSDAVDVASGCPYCHRPFRDRSPERHDGEDAVPISPSEEGGYMNPAYFKMLSHSTPRSGSPSRPPSPHKRLVQPIPPVHVIPPPTSDAEFVGSDPAPSSHGISPSAFSPNYFKTFFVEEKELGRGGKGVVLLVKHILDGVSLGHFACKRIPVGDDHEWLRKVLVEVQLLQNLSHQNLVSYRHVWLEDYQITTFGPSVPCAFILQQYCNAGDLRNYILGSVETTTTAQMLKERLRRRSKAQVDPPKDLKGPKRMQFDEIFSFFRDITSGLNHLHGHGYIHRDLKPSNCLLHNDGHKITVLVSDFGEVQAANTVRKSTGATGTISYCAPEVLRPTVDGKLGNFSTKSDIFSLGMIVYFMCFGRLPYRNADDLHEENEDLIELRAEITAWAGFDETNRRRDDLPDKLYRFLRRLLSLSPSERPSTEEILQGIKTGALDELSTPSHASLDPRARRITSVDSPAPRGRRPTDSDDIPLAKGKTLLYADNTNGALAPKRRTPPASKDVRPTLKTETSSKKATKNATNVDELSDSDRDRIDPQRQNSSVIIRPRGHLSPSPPVSGHFSPPLSQHTSPGPPKERLMLPPPPTVSSRLQSVLSTPITMAGLILSFFVVKLLSVSQPCAPYAASPWISYPLMCLAALDLVVFGVGFGQRSSWASIKMSLFALVLHIVIVWTALRAGRLCGGKVVDWAEHLHEG